MTSFVICANCQKLRRVADMARDGRCIYCRRPHLAPPALPVLGRVTHDAPEMDAGEKYLKVRAK